MGSAVIGSYIGVQEAFLDPRNAEGRALALPSQLESLQPGYARTLKFVLLYWYAAFAPLFPTVLLGVIEPVAVGRRPLPACDLLAPIVYSSVIRPVFAPFGTVSEIWVGETIVNFAFTWPKSAATTPRKLVPVSVTDAPTLPDAGLIL